MTNKRYLMNNTEKSIVEYIESHGPTSSEAIGRALGLDVETRKRALLRLRRWEIISRAPYCDGAGVLWRVIA